MLNQSPGVMLVAGSHILSGECFRPQTVHLLVRSTEQDWKGGPVSVLVWESERGFPWDQKRARRTARIDPGRGEPTVVFMGLAPGTYAVTAFAGPRRGRLLRSGPLGCPSQQAFVANWARAPMSRRFSDHTFWLHESTIAELKLAGARG